MQKVLIEKSSLTTKPNKYRFVFDGDKNNSRRFNPSNQLNFQSVLKQLIFVTNNPIQLNGSKIGMALEHPRELCLTDISILQSYSALLSDLKITDIWNNPF